MSDLRFENDPFYQSLLRDYEKAFRQHKRALAGLRRLYIVYETPDPVQAALFQQIAHDSEMRLQEAAAAFSRFAWELSPFKNDPEHLADIKSRRAEAVKRMQEPAPKQPGNAPVTIIMKMNGRTRYFQE